MESSEQEDKSIIHFTSSGEQVEDLLEDPFPIGSDFLDNLATNLPVAAADPIAEDPVGSQIAESITPRVLRADSSTMQRNIE